MRWIRNRAAVLLIIFLAFSVSASASDKTTPTNPLQHAASEQTDDHEAAHETSVSSHGQKHVDLGADLPLWSCIPFACMLLSIALWPLLMPDFWHHHFGKISGLRPCPGGPA